MIADSENKLIIIDEIQKIAILLDEVHPLIEEYDRKFILTESSARKLKYGASNLLGGIIDEMPYREFLIQLWDHQIF